MAAQPAAQVKLPYGKPVADLLAGAAKLPGVEVRHSGASKYARVMLGAYTVAYVNYGGTVHLYLKAGAALPKGAVVTPHSAKLAGTGKVQVAVAASALTPAALGAVVKAGVPSKVAKPAKPAPKAPAKPAVQATPATVPAAQASQAA